MRLIFSVYVFGGWLTPVPDLRCWAKGSDAQEHLSRVRISAKEREGWLRVVVFNVSLCFIYPPVFSIRHYAPAWVSPVATVDPGTETLAGTCPVNSISDKLHLFFYTSFLAFPP